MSGHRPFSEIRRTPKQPATAAGLPLPERVRDALTEYAKQTAADFPNEPKLAEGIRMARSVAWRAAIEAEAAAPASGSHDITDPTAPLGYQCGDPDCQEHGLTHAEPEGLDVDVLTDIIEQAIFETGTGLEAAMLAAERIARLMREREGAK